MHELRKAGLRAEQQRPIQIMYDGVIVGDYTSDILVEECVRVELKAAKALDDVHFAQCMNYLRATGMRVRLLLNLGSPKLPD